LEGYFTVSFEKIDINDFSKKLKLVIKSRFNIQKSKNRNKFLAYISLKVIKVYLFLVFQPLLRKYNN